MDYNLAKELKEAGFPLKQCQVGPDCEQWWYFPGKEAIHAPTLEELIEACGDRLTVLENWGDGWSAYEEQQDLIGVETKGSTPSEAVTRLWLAINKK